MFVTWSCFICWHSYVDPHKHAHTYCYMYTYAHNLCLWLDNFHMLTHTNTHMLTHTNTHMLTHTNTHMLTHTNTHMLTHTNTHMLTHTNTHMLTHTNTHMLTHTNTNTHTHIVTCIHMHIIYVCDLIRQKSTSLRYVVKYCSFFLQMYYGPWHNTRSAVCRIADISFHIHMYNIAVFTWQKLQYVVHHRALFKRVVWLCSHA